MLKTAVGHSNDPDSLEAIHEVLEQCQLSLEGEKPLAGILFAAIHFEHQLILDEINTVFPGIELIGGTTDGEVSSVFGFQQDSLTLMLFCSDDIELYAAAGRNISQAPVDIAAQTVAAAKAKLSTELKLCITMPESLTTSASSILAGLKSALGSVPIVGGTTGDQMETQRTYQFYKTEVLTDSVTLLLLGGNLAFSYGVCSGWNPIGKQSIITKVEKNIIYEIDEKPALELYKYYFEEFAADLAYPLAVFPPGEEAFFLRAVLTYDADLGSIVVAADVPVGSIVQVTEASQDDIVSASQKSFNQAWTNYPGQSPSAALFFSCAWRRFVLGTKTNQEYAAIAASYPYPIPSCGFYTYGEISPLSEHGETYFHNTTFVSLLLGSC